MTKFLTIALLALITPACLGQTEAPDPEAPMCAWTDETYSCPPELFTREESFVDAGDTYCRIYTYHCGDVVDTCKREVYDCQPVGSARVGGP